MKIVKYEYLNSRDLDNIRKFKYLCDNKSLVYNNLVSPFLDKYVLPYVPVNIAPNTITLFSFLFHFSPSSALCF